MLHGRQPESWELKKLPVYGTKSRPSADSQHDALWLPVVLAVPQVLPMPGQGAAAPPPQGVDVVIDSQPLLASLLDIQRALDFNFYVMKKSLLCIFYQVIWLGQCYFNNSSSKADYFIVKMAWKVTFLTTLQNRKLQLPSSELCTLGSVLLATAY